VLLRRTLLACFMALDATWAIATSTHAHAAELIMFETSGCPWCVRWHAEVGPGYMNSIEGKRAPLRIHRVETASAAGVTLAAPVVISPTFVLADHGREVGRIVGYPGPDFFWGFIGQLMAKLEKASAIERPRADLH
jgi:thioredoxin-related protein